MHGMDLIPEDDLIAAFRYAGMTDEQIEKRLAELQHASVIVGEIAEAN
jgi:hypothetical protein